MKSPAVVEASLIIDALHSKSFIFKLSGRLRVEQLCLLRLMWEHTTVLWVRNILCWLWHRWRWQSGCLSTNSMFVESGNGTHKESLSAISLLYVMTNHTMGLWVETLCLLYVMKEHIILISEWKNSKFLVWNAEAHNGSVSRTLCMLCVITEYKRDMRAQPLVKKRTTLCLLYAMAKLKKDF